MAFKLKKTKTVEHAVNVVQYDEHGKEVASKLRLRFNVITRQQWSELTDAPEDDDRLMFDVVVDSVVDEVEDDQGNKLPAAEALAAIREDLSLTGQIVTQYMEFVFGAAAKNGRRSRGR